MLSGSVQRRFYLQNGILFVEIRYFEIICLSSRIRSGRCTYTYTVFGSEVGYSYTWFRIYEMNISRGAYTRHYILVDTDFDINMPICFLRLTHGNSQRDNTAVRFAYLVDSFENFSEIFKLAFCADLRMSSRSTGLPKEAGNSVASRNHPRSFAWRDFLRTKRCVSSIGNSPDSKIMKKRMI